MDGIRKRPLRITIIGVLSIFAGLIFLFPILGSFGLAHLIDLSGQTFNEGPLVLTTTIVAIANFILGIGCLIGWRPVWLYLTVLSVLNFAIALVAFSRADASHMSTVIIPLIWLLIAIYVLVSIQSRKTKVWFGR
ncbi:MAG TPA: hypothetical protein VGK23_08870 [Methanomassiliicoccales archaeon]